MNQKIAISGINGFVGNELKSYFESLGYLVKGIPRDAIYDPNKIVPFIEGTDILINLAGANIISRWTESYKKILYRSRINTTEALVHAMEICSIKPKVFISTSAIGIYDNKSTYSENDTNFAQNFLGKLALEWEKKAEKASKIGIRTSIFRFGIVLGKNGGAFKKMVLPFKMGLGGKIADGNQGFSFIHIDDLKQAYKYIIDNENLMGVFNLTAPYPTTNLELTKTLGNALNMPTLFPVPKCILEFIFSEGSTVLTDGQKAIPKMLLNNGFKFKYSTIQEAIQNLVHK